MTQKENMSKNNFITIPKKAMPKSVQTISFAHANVQLPHFTC